MTVVAFGPLAYDVRGAELPDSFAPFVTNAASARPVEFTFGFVAGEDPTIRIHSPDASSVSGLRFAARRSVASDHVVVDRTGAEIPGLAPPGSVGIVAALAALAVLDAPRNGAIVLHAAGIRTTEGAVLILAPPGVGKSTLARAAGRRVWTHNAALVTPGALTVAWPLPFAGVPDPTLDDVAPARIAAVALFERASAAFVERATGGRATMGVMRAVVRPEGQDPYAGARAQRSLDLLTAVPVLRLGSPPDASYLAHIDRLLEIQRESTK